MANSVTNQQLHALVGFAFYFSVIFKFCMINFLITHSGRKTVPQENDIRYNYYWITVFNQEGYKAALMSLAELGMFESDLVTGGRPTRHRDVKELFDAKMPDMNSFMIGFGHKKESGHVTHLIPCSPEEVEKITAFLNAGAAGGPSSELKPIGAEHMLHYTLACTAVRI
jgi:hypothetical protein